METPLNKSFQVLYTYRSDDGRAIEMVMPGDRVKLSIGLQDAIAIEPGMQFAIREGGTRLERG
ncbi:hypothetical protein [Leptolyngbya sp. AN10]|uniref:EF-Tu C-terminal domain-related protein n=1 Tax=Leptolyngbya sp. AN10 TaxID=3423365 RepID=UPI003D31EDF9